MKRVFSILLVITMLTLMLQFFTIQSYAEDNNPNSGYIPDNITRLIDDTYDGGSFSGYIPDDEERLTGDDSGNTDPTSIAKKVPVLLTDEQKQQITAMMDVAKWYTTNDSVGNPVDPPYDEAYTTEMGEISDRIMDYGNLLLFDMGDLSQFNSVNSDYARLLNLLDNPIINPRFASYTCYLSFKDHNYKSWYNEDDWQQFVIYRNALFETLTNVNEDYLHIDTTTLTYIQKKEITVSFFDLLELYDKMTLDNAKSGDVDRDGEATVIDVTVMQRNLVGMIEFTEGQKLRATTNANASVNGADYDITSATILQRYLIGIGTENFEVIQSYNYPPEEIRPTHANYPNPEVLSQQQYRNISIWNPIICITNYADVRLTEIESQ